MTSPKDNLFSVYVLDVLGLGPDQVYVGETWYSPEDRRQQHLKGPRRGKVFKRPDVAVGALRPDLLPRLPRLIDREASRSAEALVASQLRRRGMTVHGGH